MTSDHFHLKGQRAGKGLCRGCRTQPRGQGRRPPPGGVVSRHGRVCREHLGTHVHHRACGGTVSAQEEAEGAGAEAGRLQGWVPGSRGTGSVARTPPGLASGTSGAGAADTPRPLSC